MAGSIGKIVWTDLTVQNAAEVRDFYAKVVGWDSSPVDMGGYADYNMLPQEGETPAAGICHARGMNAELPPVWLVYISIPDLDASLEVCQALGGAVLVPPKGSPRTRYAVIQDPAGAVAALIEAQG